MKPKENATIIDCFGRYSFLSPSSPDPIMFCGIRFPTMQHALLAAKTTDIATRIRISQIKEAHSATMFAETIPAGTHWTDEHRLSLIKSFIDQKFNLKTNPELVRRLKETKGQMICYINLWNDDFNGLVGGSISDLSKTRGGNHIGNALMEKRDSFFKKKKR